MSSAKGPVRFLSQTENGGQWHRATKDYRTNLSYPRYMALCGYMLGGDHPVSISRAVVPPFAHLCFPCEVIEP